MTLRLLYVCTGNVCRSPMAEHLLRAWTRGADLSVASAGIAALVGEPMDPPSAAALRELGPDPGGHRARQFTAAMAEAADLILTAERAHRDLVMTEVPAAFRRTFTMTEFARVGSHATGAPGGDPRRGIALVAAARAAAGAPDDPAADDLPDPYRGTREAATATARQVAATVRWTIDALALRPAAAAAPPVTPTAAPSAGPPAAPSPARRPQPRFRPRPTRR